MFILGGRHWLSKAFADMSAVLIVLIRAISDSYLRIGTILDVRGFALITLTILLLVLGGDWLVSIIQLARVWR
jgi:hypothetical protein